MNGERTVAWTFLAASVLVAGAAVLKGKLPTYREIFGVVGAWLLMAFMAKAAPAAASALSLLVLTTVALEKAGPFLSAFRSLMGGSKSKAKSSAKASTTAQQGQASANHARLQRKDAL